MNKFLTITAAGVFLALGSALWAPNVLGQQDDKVHSLRGTTEVNENNEAPDLKKLDTGQRFEKAYRQQPPLIPHAIEKYQINLKVNQCMRCHDWPYNVSEGAPKISETHYTNRNGVALDQVTRSRWFCTQCHVTQTRAPAIVRNDFTPATGQR